jgi:hypothetical protein
MNIWRRTHANEIEVDLKRKATVMGVDRKRLAALRESTAKELFAALESSEKEEWKLRAKEEHDDDLITWKKSLTDGPSTEPADRQRLVVVDYVS